MNKAQIIAMDMKLLSDFIYEFVGKCKILNDQIKKNEAEGNYIEISDDIIVHALEIPIHPTPFVFNMVDAVVEMVVYDILGMPTDREGNRNITNEYMRHLTKYGNIDITWLPYHIPSHSGAGLLIDAEELNECQFPFAYLLLRYRELELDLFLEQTLAGNVG